MRLDLHSDTRRTCESYQRAVAAGEHPSDVVAYLAALDGVQRPAIWRRLRSGGVLPPYQSKCTPKPRGPRKRRTMAEIANRADDLPRVNRDPCPRCGCRGDIPCGHSKAALGMVL